jgi:hypothetical protein
MTMKNTKGLGILLLAAGLAIDAPASPQVLKTPAEEANYRAYSQNEDIARFLSLADAASEDLEVRIAGRTRAVDAYPSRDIFLCILTAGGEGPASAANREKPTLLLTASQHGNEQSAKEAALRFIRDVAFGELKPLLVKINILVIPQANPYGNAFDVRENEIGLDLNRDHVKLESESVKTIHRVFRTWMPEATLDVHEKSDDYYRVSIGCVSNVNIHADLQSFSRKTILGEVDAALSGQKVPFHEYLVTEPLGMDTSSGARMSSDTKLPTEEMKRYSTTDLNDGRNSLGIYETLSFIQEGASRGDLETLAERTRWQFAGIRSFAESAAAHSGEILTLVRSMRTRLAARAEARAENDPVHLRMEYVRDPGVPQISLRKFGSVAGEIIGTLKTDKKAGETIREEDLTPARVETGTVTEIVRNWFPVVESRLSVSRPAGYIIPAERRDIIDTLLDHGIAVDKITKDVLVDVQAYEIMELVPAAEDYLAPETILVNRKPMTVPVRKGDFRVSCVHPAANLIPCLLEPQSSYGFIRYWKYRLIPEKGGLFAILRIEAPCVLPTVPYKRWT